jgi:hypothetical protein
MSDFDSAWKEALDAYFEPFMAYRLFDRYNRRVASFAILGDDRPAWRPDRFGYELWGTKVGIEFATAKLLNYAGDDAALESDSNLFAPVVLAHLRA